MTAEGEAVWVIVTLRDLASDATSLDIKHLLWHLPMALEGMWHSPHPIELFWTCSIICSYFAQSTAASTGRTARITVLITHNHVNQTHTVLSTLLSDAIRRSYQTKASIFFQRIMTKTRTEIKEIRQARNLTQTKPLIREEEQKERNG